MRRRAIWRAEIPRVSFAEKITVVVDIMIGRCDRCFRVVFCESRSCLESDSIWDHRISGTSRLQFHCTLRLQTQIKM